MSALHCFYCSADHPSSTCNSKLAADWRLCTCGDLAYEHHSDGSCLMPMCGCDGFVEVVA